MSKREQESWSDQRNRVVLMAEGDETWDLSDNDTAALQAVLDKLGAYEAEIAQLRAENQAAGEKCWLLSKVIKEQEADLAAARQQIADAAKTIKRNAVIHNEHGFVGTWVAIPMDYFTQLRALLASAGNETTAPDAGGS